MVKLTFVAEDDVQLVQQRVGRLHRLLESLEDLQNRPPHALRVSFHLVQVLVQSRVVNHLKVVVVVEMFQIFFAFLTLSAISRASSLACLKTLIPCSCAMFKCTF